MCLCMGSRSTTRFVGMSGQSTAIEACSAAPAVRLSHALDQGIQVTTQNIQEQTSVQELAVFVSHGWCVEGPKMYDACNLRE